MYCHLKFIDVCVCSKNILGYIIQENLIISINYYSQEEESDLKSELTVYTVKYEKYKYWEVLTDLYYGEVSW